ncbi:MAG TPA: hypothetical protein VN373_04760, partial [Methanosarcina barkeri]|nr:hypothetical protein [Methanosarcina barkeri]
PALSSFNRTWPSMKIKFLSVLLIFAGIILISGCVDRENQPLTYKAPGDLYRSIFYPYTGLPDHGGPEMPGVHPHDPFHKGYPPDSESIETLRDATSLLDSNIKKAEIISTRLEEGIQRFKAEGEDVSRLEALLGEYNRLLEEAKEYRALAAADKGNNSSTTDSENGLSESDERENLIRSQKSMIQANHVLKEIFEELRYMMRGSEELNSTSRLTATGDGKALLAGSFDLNIHLENGLMAIPEISPDSEIDIKGNYTFEEKTGMQDKVLVYNIQSADVNISDSFKAVMLSGTNITLTASGEGYSTFMGNGTYRVEDAGKLIKEEKWGIPFFEEGNPDEFGPDEEDHDRVTGHKIESESNIAEENRVGPEAFETCRKSRSE